MTLKLVQVRLCDGECCKASPRFPNADHSDCIYHVSSRGKERSGCTLMMNPDLIPKGDAPVPYMGLDAKGVFQETCVNWPQQKSTPQIGDTGNCCWQYVDE